MHWVVKVCNFISVYNQVYRPIHFAWFYAQKIIMCMVHAEQTWIQFVNILNGLELLPLFPHMPMDKNMTLCRIIFIYIALVDVN